MADAAAQDPPEPRVEFVVGSSRSPVVIHVPHASRTIPDWARRGLIVSDDELDEELDALTDAYTDRIAREAFEQCQRTPTLFINGLSRLVVDPERFPDDREEMLQVGMGPVYTMGYNGRELRDLHDRVGREELMTEVFDPYGRQLAEVVRTIKNRFGRVVLIDLHSYPVEPSPYELHADADRPELCIGADSFHTTTNLRSQARRAFIGFETGENTPFAGAYVPPEFYNVDSVVQSVMLEIRDDQYLNRHGEPFSGGMKRLTESIARLCDWLAK